MKRPRSYGEDLDDVGEKGVVKDWGRRELDPDRSSSHRRFYPKADSVRKGSMAYDRSLDDDRDALRPSRKRIDHESEGYERRKGFDRYRDCSERTVSVSSPRNIFSVERIHRSDSFSASRREFPKGFRSERDRSRREGSVSSWRRSNGRDGSDDDPMRFGFDSVRGNRVEDRGNTRSPQGSRDVGKLSPGSKDSGSEQSKRVELKRSEEIHGESSEMEEGELEPEREPEPEPEPEPVPEPVLESEQEQEQERKPSVGMDSEKEHLIGSETDLNSQEKSVNGDKLELDIEDDCDEKQEGGVSENMADMVREIDKVLDSQNSSASELGGKEEEEEEGEEEGEEEANGDGQKKEISEEQLSLPSPDSGSEGTEKEDAVEDVGIEKSLPPPLAEVEREVKGIDLEGEAEGIDSVDTIKEVAEETNLPEVTHTFIVDKLNENGKDKGKSPAISLSNEVKGMEGGRWMEQDLLACRDDYMEGPSSRGFELFFHSGVAKTNHSGSNSHKDEKIKLEPLELSLGLPNVSLALASHDPNPAPNSPNRARSVHSLPSTFHTNSNGFTASMSCSGSQTFAHNPSCSLTQNSFENYEHSVGSHPIFQGVDQVSHNNTWQGSASNEPKRKEVSLYQRTLLNGNGSLHASQASQGILNYQPAQGHHSLKASEGSSGIPNGLDRQSSLQRQFSGHYTPNEVRSPTHSVGSRETKSEHSKDKKRVRRERHSGGLFRTSHRETEQLVLSGNGVLERIVAKIVSEPIQMMARTIQEMTDQSIMYLKDSICEIIAKEDKQGLLRVSQDALQSRSDLTLETLSKSHRAQLEILVALKTGLQDFLKRSDNIPSSDLVEIFLNLKCRNLACRSSLPVDECDCKVCVQKNGFCSACMCLVCSKFDLASNTCSWVGCDFCLHWCHTDCGLRDNHIRNGRSVTGPQGMSEMQFHCIACDRPSEMFGFVKDVFKTCAKDWKVETLSNELEYVRRIFHSSNDKRGKQLHDVADRMLAKLETKSNLSEVYNCLMMFLTESDSKLGNTPSTSSVKELSQKNPGEGSNGVVGPSQESMWLTSVSQKNPETSTRVLGPSQKAMWLPTEKTPRWDNAGGVIPSLDWDCVGRRAEDLELQPNVEKKPVVDELESIVRIKQAEAKMFQERADDARREAEGLKRIASAKNEKIEEDYTSRITKLRLVEAEERRRQKFEELQVLERAHREYVNMKLRMEADIKDLLLKMEATKRNLGM